MYSRSAGPTRFRADNIQPIMPRRKGAPPVFQAEEIIGRKGNFFSVLALRLLAPTVEYPDMAISLSLHNGRDYTFAQVKPEELDNLISKLQEWRDKIQSVVPTLEQQAAAIRAQREAYEQRVRDIKQAQELAAQMADPGDMGMGYQAPEEDAFNPRFGAA